MALKWQTNLGYRQTAGTEKGNFILDPKIEFYGWTVEYRDYTSKKNNRYIGTFETIEEAKAATEKWLKD